MDRNCSLLLALPWCLLWACPAASSAQCRQNLQTGPFGHGQKFPRAVPARCPHGPLWRRALALPRRRGIYPRSRQQGAPLRLGLRGGEGRCCASRRCTALRSALARTGPGPLDAVSQLVLPAGRAPAAGECGMAGAAARWRAGSGRAAGLVWAGKAGGRRGPPAPPPSLYPGSSGPDSPLRSPAAPRT